MALRVLLADESSTIKKVFQLALQDFGVEVRPVNIGVDVSTVAKAFKPDIVFADVLLQKKNGYDVCSELKQDRQTQGVPVVLMWSGFMELDEDKFQASQANAQLEKPFDVTALRKLVSDLVPRTQAQKLAEYLTFPKATVEAAPMPDFVEPKAKADEDFQQVPIPKMKSGADKYRLNLQPEELDPSHIPVEYDLPAEKVAVDEILASPEAEEEPFKMRETKASQTRAKVQEPASPPPAVKAIELEDADDIPLPTIPGRAMPAEQRQQPTVQTLPPALTPEQLEKIIREQSAEVIESVVWKVIPELAAQIIERELNKLLKERDNHPY